MSEKDVVFLNAVVVLEIFCESLLFFVILYQGKTDVHTQQSMLERDVLF